MSTPSHSPAARDAGTSRRRDLRGRLAAALGTVTAAALLTVGSLFGHAGATTVQAATLTVPRSTSTTSTTSTTSGASSITTSAPASTAASLRVASSAFVPAPTGSLWSAWAPGTSEPIVSAASGYRQTRADGESFAL